MQRLKHRHRNSKQNQQTETANRNSKQKQQTETANRISKQNQQTESGGESLEKDNIDKVWGFFRLHIFR